MEFEEKTGDERPSCSGTTTKLAGTSWFVGLAQQEEILGNLWKILKSTLRRHFSGTVVKYSTQRCRKTPSIKFVATHFTMAR